MNAAELRIGNWIWRKSGPTISIPEPHNYATTIKGVTKDGPMLIDKFSDVYPWEELLPIPLTEEILLKCNFILLDGRYKFSDNEWFSVAIEGVWCSLYCNGIYYAVDFKYVHQLQNLYFALTGQELNIEL